MKFSPAQLENAYDYASYRQLINRLLAENKTTGENHSEAMLEYTRLNQSRMNRVEKTFKLSAELDSAIGQLEEPLVWVVLTEAWCGDAAQNIPTLAKIAEAFPEKIELKFLLRDENLEIMDQYLTNGGRSIPKLIMLRKSDGQEVGTWGPRPAAAQQKVLELKAQPDFDKEKMNREIHMWYARDRGNSLQAELAALLREMAPVEQL